MEQISVFDIIKIGIGPSSSHTMGPWKAAQLSLQEALQDGWFAAIQRVRVELLGSLAKTGKGHGTDIAVILGLNGEDHTTIDTNEIGEKVRIIKSTAALNLAGQKPLPFDADKDLIFNFRESLDFHPNGMRFRYELADGQVIEQTYFSIGGGFVLKADEEPARDARRLPYPCQSGADLAAHCQKKNSTISEIVFENEKTWRSEAAIHEELDLIWQAMIACVYRGCHTQGILPGGLNVRRRAAGLNAKLFDGAQYHSIATWLDALVAARPVFHETLKWVSCIAIAANEENASFGRIVTAPTNGASGVLPAVLFYFYCFCKRRATMEDVRRFLLVAGEFGSIFKKGATISGALGGCQAEIGVSSAMAAGALTECLGGSVGQALMAAEIAMEHHLGLTCDPVAGLVQIPCIERNSMGAIKAITAANIALESDPAEAKVSLDSIIGTMWATAQDMHSKYKETSEGGLAVHVPVNVVDC